MGNEKNELRWILCPVCGGMTRGKVRVDTILEHFPLFCPKCKRGILIDLKEQSVHIAEPDA